jgi:hypothetical protein
MHDRERRRLGGGVVSEARAMPKVATGAANRAGSRGRSKACANGVQALHHVMLDIFDGMPGSYRESGAASTGAFQTAAARTTGTIGRRGGRAPFQPGDRARR